MLYYYSCDIKRCIDSAEKGFKIWSTKSITSRNQILFKFASMLKCNGYVKYMLYIEIIYYIYVKKFLYILYFAVNLYF